VFQNFLSALIATSAEEEKVQTHSAISFPSFLLACSGKSATFLTPAQSPPFVRLLSNPAVKNSLALPSTSSILSQTICSSPAKDESVTSVNSSGPGVWYVSEEVEGVRGRRYRTERWPLRKQAASPAGGRREGVEERAKRPV